MAMNGIHAHDFAQEPSLQVIPSYVTGSSRSNPIIIDDTEPAVLGSARSPIPSDSNFVHFRPSSPIFRRSESPAERASPAPSGSPANPVLVDGTELAPPRSAAEHVPSDSEPLHSRMGSPVSYELQHAYPQTDGQNPCGIEHFEDRETDGDTEIASTPGEYVTKSYLATIADLVHDMIMTSKPTVMDDLPTQAQEDTRSPSLFSPGNECQVTMCPTTTGNPELCHEQNTLGDAMDATVMTVNDPTDETVSNTAIPVGVGSHDREIPGEMMDSIFYNVAEESAHEAESVTDIHQHSYAEVPLAESREMSTPASNGPTRNATSSSPRAREAEAGANHDTASGHQEPSNIECHSPEVGQARAVNNHEPSDDYNYFDYFHPRLRADILCRPKPIGQMRIRARLPCFLYSNWRIAKFRVRSNGDLEFYAYNRDLELGKRDFQERAASDPELRPRSPSRHQSPTNRATRKRAAPEPEPEPEPEPRRSSRLQSKRARV